MYDPNKKQRPIKFENCNLPEVPFLIAICRMLKSKTATKGLRINGVSIEDLIKLHT